MINSAWEGPRYYITSNYYGLICIQMLYIIQNIILMCLFSFLFLKFVFVIFITILSIHIFWYPHYLFLSFCNPLFILFHNYSNFYFQNYPCMLNLLFLCYFVLYLNNYYNFMFNYELFTEKIKRKCSISSKYIQF